MLNKEELLAWLSNLESDRAERTMSTTDTDKFGYGIQRCQSLLKDNGNPPAEFEIDDKVFGVSLWRKKA